MDQRRSIRIGGGLHDQGRVGRQDRVAGRWGVRMGTARLGVGSKVALIVFLPLIIVAAAGYIYFSQLTNITSQIDQIIQTYSGVSVAETKNIVLSILCGLVVLIGLIAALYGSRLAGRIKSLTHIVDRVSAGETDAVIEIKTGGEISALTEAISRMRDNLR